LLRAAGPGADVVLRETGWMRRLRGAQAARIRSPLASYGEAGKPPNTSP
jgi:hypothetical protein